MKNILVLWIFFLIILVSGITVSDNAKASDIRSYTTQKININKPPPPMAAEVIITEPEVLISPELETEILSEVLAEIETESTIIPETIIVEQQKPVIALQDEKNMAAPNAPNYLTDGGYILGAEDKIKVNVYGEKELSGDYKLGSDGTIAMPLIGVVNIEDMTLRQAEEIIEDQLRDGYLKDPSVSIEVQESRPFYIMGEIRRPGSYNYINGMNVLQAVAISGGFTYRANQKTVEVVRGKATPAKPIKIKPEDIVRPGDIIFVKERFF